jgi:hypothetical protein
MITILFLITLESSAFLKLTPGVVAQGLGGSSVTVDEGLSVFHNPAYADERTFNFVLSRWLYSTNYLAAGCNYGDYLFGVTYMNYGQISGYDELGSPTSVFTPYDICIALGRRFGVFGLGIKGFTERIADQTLYGLAATLGLHLQRGPISLGLKIDNIGKEFAKSTAIPCYTAIGLKYNISSDFGVIIEGRIPDPEMSTGIAYRYKDLTLLFGAKYQKNISGQENIMDNLGFTGGLLVSVDIYRIGYSIVYGYLSIAHQFSVSITP